MSSDDAALPLCPCRAIYGEGWQLWEGSTKITQPSTYALYDRMQGPITRGWWRRKKILPVETLKDINWQATADMMTKAPHHVRFWVTKQASANCGVGTTLQEWKYQDHARCPRCECPHEDTNHVLQCQGQGTTRTFRKSLQVLRTYMKDNHTSPLVRHTMLRCIRKWRNREPIRMSTIPEGMRTAVRAQTRIGWKNLLEGVIADQWIQAQCEYYHTNQLRKSGQKWAAGTLRKTVEIGRALWLHRNDCKHRTMRKDDKRMEAKLNRDITREVTRGVRDLLPGDRNCFKTNLITLLNKPLQYKKSWWDNINVARQRSERIKRNEEAWKRQSRAKSSLYAWMTKYRQSTQGLEDDT